MTTHRYHTRVIIRIDSHISGEHVLTEDVIRFQSNKQIKGRGRFQFGLIPNRNYLNIIYPNDVVNVYIDVGDGKHGFVRTMMGYVDRINRTEVTNAEQGTVSTVFTVMCSDFQKAIEMTNVYFNPHMQTAIDSRFKNTLLGEGSTLRTNGVVASGTPSDFVENLLLTLAGFGQQWVLPDSYPPFDSKKARRKRAHAAKRRLPGQLVEDLKNTGLIQGAEGLNEFSQNIDKYLDVARKVLKADDKVKQGSFDPIVMALTGEPEKQLAARLEKNALSFRVYKYALDYLSSSLPPGIVDLMEFGFIEHLAIDGYNVNLAVWQSQGSLAQIIYGRSNPIVNELMFDLRPVSRSETGRVVSEGAYSTLPDELGINVKGAGSSGPFAPNVNGVEYVPAVVMREYPYSTVEGFDLSNYYTFEDGPPAGFIPFGPIFSKPAEGQQDEQRLIYDYSTVFNGRNAATLRPDACLFDTSSATRPIKHLDVVKIEDDDIVNMNVGRDDNDVINLFAIYSNSAQAKNWKFMLQGLSPVINPVSIARNGLRVQEPKTDWANYSRDPECNLQGSTIDNGAIRRNLIRWQLLMDHWYQHNNEYLSGTCDMRGMPWVRAGYRLDFVDRNESYYVESVAHNWEYPGPLRTSVQLSRGQRNDPFPAYVPPATPERYIRSYKIPRGISQAKTVRVSDEVAAVTGQDIAVSENIAEEGLTVTQEVIINTHKNNPGAEPVTDGGNRGFNGRLSDYFFVKATKGTLYATTRQLTDRDEEGNEIDNPVNKDLYGKGRIEYPGTVPTKSSAGRFGAVPSEPEYDDEELAELEERQKAIEELDKIPP